MKNTLMAEKEVCNLRTLSSDLFMVLVIYSLKVPKCASYLCMFCCEIKGYVFSTSLVWDAG